MANDYDVKIGSLKRRRGLLDALTQQSMTPDAGRMVGQIYVGPSLLDALAKPLTAAIANYGQERLDKQENQLARERQSGLVDALMGLPQGGGMDFTQAAMSSDYPEVQKLGEANFLAGLKQQQTPEKFGTSFQTVIGADGKPQLVQLGNRGTQNIMSGMSPYQEPSFGNVKTIQRPDGSLGYIAVDKSGQTKEIEGVDAYQRPPAQTNINLNNKQESAFGQQLGKKDAERYDAANTVLANEANQMDMIGRVKALEESPMLRGGAAPLGIKAAEIAHTFGIEIAPDAVANAEQLDAVLQQAVVNFIQQGGRGITDEEGKRMMKTWPGLLQTAQGAKQVRMQMEEINRRNIRQAQVTQKAIRQRYPDAFQSQPSAPAQPSPSGIKFLGFE